MDILTEAQDIKKLLKDRQWWRIKKVLLELKAPDIVDIWESLSERNILIP